MEDESQMDLAVHGELAGKIVEQIFDQVFFLPFGIILSTRFPHISRPFVQNHQVQKNKDLKVSLGPGLYYKHKVRDTVTADDKCHQSFSNDKVRFLLKFTISSIWLMTLKYNYALKNVSMISQIQGDGRNDEQDRLASESIDFRGGAEKDLHFPAPRFDGVFGLDVGIEFANDIVATSNTRDEISLKIKENSGKIRNANFHSSYHRRYRL